MVHEGSTLSEIRQRKTNTTIAFEVESNKANLIETETKMVVARDWGWGDGWLKNIHLFIK